MGYREMDDQETELFILLHSQSNVQSDALFQKMIEDDSVWVLKAIQKRFKAAELVADKKTMIMILFMGDGVVGKCAKYVDDIYLRCKKQGIEKLTFETFTKDIYPLGFPF